MVKAISFLRENFKESVTKLLVRVHASLKEDYLLNNEFQTMNGIHFFKWDKLNTACLNGEVEDVMAILARRGPWAFVTLFDPDSGTLITLMNERNLDRKVLTYGKNREPHYVYSFSSFNRSITALGDLVLKESYQEEFFPLCEDEYWMNRIKAMQSELLGSIHSRVKQHVVVSFRAKGKTVEFVQCAQYSAEMFVLAEENWNHLIDLPYSDEELEIAETPIAPSDVVPIDKSKEKKQVVKLRENIKRNDEK